jgi:hypothetical protein
MFFRRQKGQSTVEVIAALPVVLVVMLAGWQLVVAGHCWWKLHEVARISAREVYVAGERGEQRSGLKRARKIAGGMLAASPASSRGLSVSADGVVSARARVPLVEPFRSVLGESAGPLLAARSRLSP